jgi:hypothetical protein
MDDLFCPYIRKFVVVSVDVILIIRGTFKSSLVVDFLSSPELLIERTSCCAISLRDFLVDLSVLACTAPHNVLFDHDVSLAVVLTDRLVLLSHSSPTPLAKWRSCPDFSLRTFLKDLPFLVPQLFKALGTPLFLLFCSFKTLSQVLFH